MPRSVILFMFAAISLHALKEASGSEPMPPSDDGIIRAEVAVDTYAYKPDRLVVRAGRPVEITLKSLTLIVPHNFVIKAPELGLEINQDVPAGKTVTVRFAPTRAGEAKFYCDKKLLFFKSHEGKGMVGTLEIREGTEKPSEAPD